MSIESVGFGPWDTLFPNTLFRVTFSDHSYDLFDQFPGAVAGVYAKLYPSAHLIPTTRLAVVSGDKSAVVDANLKEEISGADILNRLSQMGTRFAFVSRVEKLSDEQKQASSSGDGLAERAKVQGTASVDVSNSGIFKAISANFGSLGTLSKLAAIAVILLALGYLVHAARE